MKHAHKFLRIQAKKTWTWTCTECSWFVHDGLSHVMYGKDAECWGCGDIFKITAAAMAEDKPRCDSCRGISSDAINQLLKEKGLLDGEN